MFKFLSFCICFPVSEAIVESWGSTITFLYSLKHHPGEVNDDIDETGTIDKLTFIKLNEPPPAMDSTKNVEESSYFSF